MNTSTATKKIRIRIPVQCMECGKKFTAGRMLEADVLALATEVKSLQVLPEEVQAALEVVHAVRLVDQAIRGSGLDEPPMWSRVRERLAALDGKAGGQ